MRSTEKYKNLQTNLVFLEALLYVCLSSDCTSSHQPSRQLQKFFCPNNGQVEMDSSLPHGSSSDLLPRIQLYELGMRSSNLDSRQCFETQTFEEWRFPERLRAEIKHLGKKGFVFD